RMAVALKPGMPFVFTFHHNELTAYASICVATLDAGLTCSATLPAPAEMGGSIHISGTGSSIIDSIFVCRTKGRVKRSRLASNAQELAELIRKDLEQLRAGGVAATRGDVRCIAAGHLSRLAIWHLRLSWDRHLPIIERINKV